MLAGAEMALELLNCLSGGKVRSELQRRILADLR